MSENTETPKRKRRTREEIEAAKAAGTYKPRTKKAATNPVETETPVPKEQSVLIMACLNPYVSKTAIDAAKEKGVEVVILEDKVIQDYLEAKEKKTDNSLSDFLNNASNRLQAERQCIKLWTILSEGKPIENAEQYVFTRKEVVKKTNLSHSKAEQLFQLLRVFGLLTFTKGTHEFTLNFSAKGRQQSIKTEVLAMCGLLKSDILRYKNAVDNDPTLDENQKDELLADLKKEILKEIGY